MNLFLFVGNYYIRPLENNMTVPLQSFFLPCAGFISVFNCALLCCESLLICSLTFLMFLLLLLSLPHISLSASIPCTPFLSGHISHIFFLTCLSEEQLRNTGQEKRERKKKRGSEERRTHRLQATVSTVYSTSPSRCSFP